MAKYAAFGTALLLDGVEIGQVTSIGGPSFSLDTIDVTTHDQAQPWEQFVASILRSGELTLDLSFDPADTEHVALLNQMVGKSFDSFELDFPDAGYTEWQFAAYVTGFEVTMEVSDKISGSLTLKITGEPVLTGTYVP